MTRSLTSMSTSYLILMFQEKGLELKRHKKILNAQEGRHIAQKLKIMLRVHFVLLYLILWMLWSTPVPIRMLLKS